MFKNALIGFIISLICVLPPLIHFISGPLGPFIGGWIAGTRTKAGLEQSISIGIIMGALFLAPILVMTIFGSSILPLENLDVDKSMGLIMGLAIMLYVAILGAIGSAVGGHMARKPDSIH